MISSSLGRGKGNKSLFLFKEDICITFTHIQFPGPQLKLHGYKMFSSVILCLAETSITVGEMKNSHWHLFLPLAVVWMKKHK